MPLLFNKLVCKLIHHRHAKIIRELCELPYGTGVETAKTERLRNKMLTTIFPKFDGFFSISETLSEFVKKYAPKAKNLKIPILVDVSISENVKPHKSTYPYIFHSGTLYEQKDGVVGMLEGFAIANKQLHGKYDFIMTGKLEDSMDKKKIMMLLRGIT